MITTGDGVKHKKDKDLVRGRVLEISVSRKTAKVYWDKKWNNRLVFNHCAQYRIDSLEKLED